MEGLIILASLGVAGWWLYKTGKRLGSRKGYGVGRKHGRRRRS